MPFDTPASRPCPPRATRLSVRTCAPGLWASGLLSLALACVAGSCDTSTNSYDGVEDEGAKGPGGSSEEAVAGEGGAGEPGGEGGEKGDGAGGKGGTGAAGEQGGPPGGADQAGQVGNSPGGQGGAAGAPSAGQGGAPGLGGRGGMPGAGGGPALGGGSGTGGSPPAATNRPRVIVSSDIGGDDPDDFQSLVHYLVYADRFDTEGLVSSPPGPGRKRHIDEVLDAYAADHAKLKTYGAFPTPQSLRAVTVQGASSPAPSMGFGSSTEGSRLIVDSAKRNDARPVYVLVWGSMTDVAQAVHDEPAIKSKLRVYSIGSWNTDQDRSARDYLFDEHADMWWIENDTTFRGMYSGGSQSGDLGNTSFVDQHIKGHGALGALFVAKKVDIKMGDTPSVLYLLNGDPADPTKPSWGGMFRKTGHGPNYFHDMTDSQYKQGTYNGAKTVNTWREAYLRDWQTRMEWARRAK